MGTPVKHPMSDQVKSSFVIFDIRALSRPRLPRKLCIASADHGHATG